MIPKNYTIIKGGTFQTKNPTVQELPDFLNNIKMVVHSG